MSYSHTYRKRVRQIAHPTPPVCNSWLSESETNREEEGSNEPVASNGHQLKRHAHNDDQVELASDEVLFSVEELNGIEVIKKGANYIEVECGCTNYKFGDAAGKLTIYSNGKLEISCDCYPGCPGEKLSPSEFEKHAMIKVSCNWQARVWVFNGGQKVPLRNTKLLKYYKGSASDPSFSIKPLRSQTRHRNELMTCTACGKERQFERRNQEECKIYHEASLASESWTCSDHPKGLTCEVKEDRGSKKKFSGCLRQELCKGCISCVCFGCNMCRFKDCSCRTCVDFIQNAEPGAQD